MYTLKFAPEKILFDSMYKGCLEIRSILAQYTWKVGIAAPRLLQHMQQLR